MTKICAEVFFSLFVSLLSLKAHINNNFAAWSRAVLQNKFLRLMLKMFFHSFFHSSENDNFLFGINYASDNGCLDKHQSKKLSHLYANEGPDRGMDFHFLIWFKYLSKKNAVNISRAARRSSRFDMRLKNNSHWVVRQSVKF